MSWAKKRKKRLIHLQAHPHRNSLTGLISPVGLYLSVFTCREKTYIAMQKEEIWIGQFNMRLGV
jgi:hypothetical protein